MERLNRSQAIWLARGVALGGFLLRLMPAVRAVLAKRAWRQVPLD